MDASPKNDWLKVACAGIFFPMAVNLLVLATYYYR